MNGIASRLAGLYPETNREVGARVTALREQVVHDARRGLILLLGAVGVVLLGACVNVANLLLMKAAATRRQMAVQHALGASRARLVTQVLTETLLLGIAGAALGLFLAYGGLAAFIAAGPPDIPLLPAGLYPDGDAADRRGRRTRAGVEVDQPRRHHGPAPGRT